MNKGQMLRRISACLMVMLLLTGCGKNVQNKAEGQSSSAQQAEEVQDTGTSAEAKTGSTMAAMIISIPQGDPFLTLAYAGVEQLGKEYGIETKVIEALEKSEYNEQVRAMAEAGADPLYVVWDDLAAEAVKIAPEFPDTRFILVDCYMTSELDNVETIVVEPQEAAFIAGVVAANMTESGQVAWLGSTDQPVINKFRQGFESGVAYADKGAVCESLYIGDPNDPNKGGELAKQVIGKGADVIMHSANQSGLGVIRACEEMKVKAIGVDEWQGSINEEIVVWSALKDITGAVYNAGKGALDGEFVSGMQVYNAASGAAMYDSRDYDKLSDELKAIVDEVQAKLVSGEIVIGEE